MKSYHDLEDQIYKSVREKPFQRMGGKRSWQKWVALRDESVKLAVTFKVSYIWSKNKGLMALIYGAERLAEEFPDFPPYVKPATPPNISDYADGADEDDRREARANLDIQRRDYAVVQGFIRGYQENILNAVESRLYQDLEHIRFGFDNVWPKAFLDEIKTHCPLDVQSIKEAKQHFARPWDRHNKLQPETIKRFGLRLTQEQDSLHRDGVTISNKDKLEHYLLEIYQSRAFSNEVI